jgi:hypothetical protein
VLADDDRGDGGNVQIRASAHGYHVGTIPGVGTGMGTKPVESRGSNANLAASNRPYLHASAAALRLAMAKVEGSSPFIRSHALGPRGT